MRRKRKNNAIDNPRAELGRGFFGYDKKKTDAYLNLTLAQFERTLSAQREAIAELKIKNDSLESDYSKLKTREEEVKKVLLAAVEKSGEIQTTVKLQYAMELERLKIFQAKWTSAYEEMKKKYHFDKDALQMESVVMTTALELEQLMNRDFGISVTPSGDEPEQQFKAELDRLGINQDELSKLINTIRTEFKSAREKDA